MSLNPITGELYHGKTPPVAETGKSGLFRLTVRLIDNMGRNPQGIEVKEAHEIEWYGPEAKAFWEQHSADLVKGAVVSVVLENPRAIATGTYPPQAHIRTRAVRLAIIPKRQPARPEQLSKQEQATANA